MIITIDDLKQKTDNSLLALREGINKELKKLVDKELERRHYSLLTNSIYY